jgi:hypothetical protein
MNNRWVVYLDSGDKAVSRPTRLDADEELNIHEAAPKNTSPVIGTKEQLMKLPSLVEEDFAELD